MTEHLAEWYRECVLSYVPRRRHWTVAHRVKGIEVILRMQPNRSSRSIAAETGFSRELVARVRNDMIAKGRIEDQFRKGMDGKLYRRSNERVLP